LKFIERFLQYATVPWVIAYFLLPLNIWSIGMFGLIFTAGLWTVLHPQGILRIAKAAHPAVNLEDQRLWWGARVIGLVFILVSIVAVVGVLANSR
jgi:hypothetical protein